METVSRKPWVIRAMTSRMEERIKVKTTNVKDYRRCNNQLRRETDRAHMKDICDEIIDLPRKGRYDLMYHKAQHLGRRATKSIRTFAMKDNQGKIVRV